MNNAATNALIKKIASVSKSKNSPWPEYIRLNVMRYVHQNVGEKSVTDIAKLLGLPPRTVEDWWHRQKGSGMSAPSDENIKILKVTKEPWLSLEIMGFTLALKVRLGVW